MTPQDFVVWFNGFFDISKAISLNATQTQIIKDKLAQVDHIQIQQIGTCTCWVQGLTYCPQHGKKHTDWTLPSWDQITTVKLPDITCNIVHKL